MGEVANFLACYQDLLCMPFGLASLLTTKQKSFELEGGMEGGSEGMQGRGEKGGEERGRPL